MAATAAGSRGGPIRPEKRRSTRVTTDPAVLAIYGLAPAPDGPVADLARFRSRRARLGGTRAAQHPSAHDGEQPWPLAQRVLHAGCPWPVRSRLARHGSFAPDEDILEVDSSAPPGLGTMPSGSGETAWWSWASTTATWPSSIRNSRRTTATWWLALLPSEHGDEDLATLKVFELRQGQAWLVAANPVYAPIPIEQAWVLGRVTTIVRRFYGHGSG